MAPVPVAPGLLVTDSEGHELVLDAAQADDLWRVTGALEAATVSACPRCRSRILATVALEDLLDALCDALAPFDLGPGLRRIAAEAPTLHLYVVDVVACSHRAWRDPGYDEWMAVADDRPRLRRV